MKQIDPQRLIVFFYIRLPLIIGFCLMLSIKGPSQTDHGQIQTSLKFSQISTEHGLSDTRVESIFQDSKGFMWFGTARAGLNRFDGRKIRTWVADPDHPELNYPPFGWGFAEDGKGNLWIAGGDGLYLYHTDQDRFEAFRENLNGEKVITTGIYLDRRGNLWVGSSAQAMMRFDPVNQQFIALPEKFKSNLKTNFKPQILEDSFGDLWFSNPNGIFRYVWSDSSLIYHPLREDLEREVNDRYVLALYEDSRKDLWVGTEKDLQKYDREAEKFFRVPLDQPAFGCSNICEGPDGKLWLTAVERSGGGLYFVDPPSPKVSHYLVDEGDPNTMRTDIVQSLYRDPIGGMWLGTIDAGVFYWSQDRKAFTTYHLQTTGHHNLLLFDKEKKNIWKANGEQLERYEFKAWRFPALAYRPNFRVTEDKQGRIWVGSWNYGLTRYDPADQSRVNYRADPARSGSLSGNAVITILADQQGTIWAGVHIDQIFRYDPVNDDFIPHLFVHSQTGDTLQGVWAKSMYEDQTGSMWIGARAEAGLLKLNTDYTVDHIFDIPDPYDFYEDDNGFLWVGTPGGLYRVDPQNKTFKVWRTKDGLPHNLVYSMLADDHGNLWLGTQKGLSRFDPNSEIFRNFDTSDGLPADVFTYYQQAMKTPSGEFFFGTTGGLLHFHPDDIRKNPNIPPIVITDFQIRNQSVPIRGSFADTLKDITSPLLKAVTFTKEIHLNWNQQDISFEFTALNYLQPEKNKYKYRLEPYDETWIETDAQRPYATYTNLNPGEYLFQVCGSNNDGKWNNEGTVLKIIIFPPWWRTNFAYVLYLVFILGTLYAIRFYELRRKLSLAEAKRLKELNEIKSRLYTNITHEFRTPLTVISGMIDQIAKDPQKWFREGVSMIKRSTRQLLHLVNQLLDLSKLESQTMPLNLQQAEVISYLQYLVQSVQPFAASKSIGLHFHSKVEELILDFDPDKLSKIVSNLLSNAIKFTSGGGHVYVIVAEREKHLVIEVRDTGIGIQADQIPHIFDRFYQADDSHTRNGGGTGIGLALTREFVHLMKGRISVKSKVGEGSEFTFSLPISRQAPVRQVKLADISGLPEAESISRQAIATSAVGAGQDLPTVLIIEDNKDVARYIASCLEGQYQVEIAFNGQEGIDSALELVPDIIISDVMMPGKDGYEVTGELKKDERTSHIPILLLTAKADIDAKVKGLEYGADAYLYKPFEPKELEVRLRKLIELRELLRLRYASMGLLSQTKDHALQKEEAFLLKLREVVEDHIDDETFGIPQILRAMGISRTQLHNKLKALTGRSTSQIVKSIRLQKAKTLLESTDMNVSEVSNAVGFRNLSYFSSCFSEEFGKAPSEVKGTMP